ncbi:MAG: macro domain-containing protein [Verrucomicrobia bacterium]|nr:macro domain-containing protein [Verrucomicrobiota bacterium]
MNPTSKRIGNATLELQRGDITALAVDAIVNAANVHLQHGGGVALAIVRKGGQVIQDESDRIIDQLGRPLDTGEAVITTGGELPAKFVIHTAGPIWGDGDEDAKLRRACISSLALADGKKLKSIAFPAISTGIYRFPLERAARVLLRAAADYLGHKTRLQRVIFCLYDEKTYDEFVRALAEI